MPGNRSRLSGTAAQSAGHAVPGEAEDARTGGGRAPKAEAATGRGAAAHGASRADGGPLPPAALPRRAAIEAEYDQVLGSLSDPAVLSDPARLRELSRRAKELEEVVAAARAVEAAAGDLTAARELLAESDPSSRELARAELAAAEARLAAAEEELDARLVPKDANDGKGVLVEIRGAEGGEEANLFAKDLYEMYVRFAERRGWRLEPLAMHVSALGGYDEVSFVLRGEDAWRRMHHEAGPHRVQRVPVTESQGRVHTSAATVAVLPEADETEVRIDPSELRIEVYRSTGPGGQSVNTTDSAVRVTHLPSGIVVAMQDERSQLQNRAKAMAVLRARLAEAQAERQSAEASVARRAQLGGGGRSEKIRTYNFKENRVTDHRINLTVYKLDRVLAGELEEISDALVADEQARHLASAP